MASYMKFELQDGTQVFIEVTEGQKNASGLLPSTRSENILDQSPISFDESFDAIRKMAAGMVQKLRNGFDTDPEEVNISFGVKAAQELNSLAVARSGMDSNFGISVRWRNGKKAEEEVNEKEKADSE